MALCPKLTRMERLIVELFQGGMSVDDIMECIVRDRKSTPREVVDRALRKALKGAI